MNTVRRVVNGLHGIVCALIGHRFRQQKRTWEPLDIYRLSTPRRCTRCGALAANPFHTGSEEYR